MTGLVTDPDPEPIAPPAGDPGSAGEPPSPPPSDPQQGTDPKPDDAKAASRSHHEDMLKKFGGDPEKAGEDYWRIQNDNKSMAKHNADLQKQLEELQAKLEGAAPPAEPDEPEDDYDPVAHLADIDSMIQGRAAFIEAAPKERDKILQNLNDADNKVFHYSQQLKELEEELQGADEFERASIEKRLGRVRSNLQGAQGQLATASNAWSNLYAREEQFKDDLRRLKTERQRVVRDQKAAREREKEEAEAVEVRAEEYRRSYQKLIVDELKAKGITDEKVLNRGWKVVKNDVAMALFRSSQTDGNINVKQIVQDSVQEFLEDRGITKPAEAEPKPQTPVRRAPGERPAVDADKPPTMSAAEAYEKQKQAARTGLSRAMARIAAERRS